MPADRPVVFVDADTLARPVTRTLLIAGADVAGVTITWSEIAELQANRHLPPKATSITSVRELLGRELGPTGGDAGRFADTALSDRQILADAVRARAHYLVTADVDDFAEVDLGAAAVSAVNPDLFMSIRFAADAYEHALQQMVVNMKHPPRGVGEMHALIARQHPRLFARHAAMFPGVAPVGSRGSEPKTLFRGSRCLGCGNVVSEPRGLELGLHPGCRASD